MSVIARRVILMVMGIGLLVFAFVAPLIGFEIGLDGLSAARLMLGGIGGLVILIGVFGDRATSGISRAFQGIAGLLMITLIVALVLETAAVLLLNVLVMRFAPDAAGINRDQRPYYQTVDWGAAYWQEHSEAVDYAPYVIWRHVPQSGAAINVDENGVRLTPGAVCESGSYRVFVFGGSTVWGLGAPDWATIPAFLQTALDAALDQPVCVVNYGDMGYVTAQEVVRLSLELQAGNIPSAAVFFDGLNDVYAAFQSGTAGMHQNQQAIAARFDAPAPDALTLVIQQSALYRMLALYAIPQGDQSITYESLGVDSETLAGAVAQHHAEQRAFAARLAESYGFDLFWFWQPMITTTNKPLTDYETRTRDGLDTALITLYRETHTQISGADADLIDLSRVLDAVEGELWIDSAHVIPEANTVIADAIAEIMLSASVGARN